MNAFAERLSAFLKKVQLIMTTKISSPMPMKLNSSLEESYSRQWFY